MSSLTVHARDGTCLYPADGTDDPSVEKYFDSVVFVAEFDEPSNPALRAQFGAVLPDGGTEQVFLQFEGNNPSTLLTDVRQAVVNELHQDAGWKFQEASPEDPWMVFQRTILQLPDDPESVLDGTKLENTTDELYKAASKQSLTVTASDYEAIAKAIHTFADESLLLTVTKGDLSVPKPGIVIHQQSQEQSLGLPPQSTVLLERVTLQEESDVADESGAADQDEPTGTATEEGSASSTGSGTAGAGAAGAAAGSSTGSSSAESTSSTASADTSSTQSTSSTSSSTDSSPKPSTSSTASSAGTGTGSSGTASTGAATTGSQTASSSTSQPSTSTRSSPSTASTATTGTSSDTSGERLGGDDSPVAKLQETVATLPTGVKVGAGIGAIILFVLLVGVSLGLPGAIIGGDDGEFEVTLDTPTEVDAGDSFDVTVSVENVGEEAGAASFTLWTDPDIGEHTLEPELEAGESATETVTFTAAENPPEAYTVVAEGEDVNESATVSVAPPAQPAADLSELDIAGQGQQATVDEGTDEDITADVENVGDAEGTFDVVLTIDDVERTESVTLDVGESTTVTFEDVISGLDAGVNEVTVTALDDTLSGELQVNPVGEALFEITAMEATPVIAGDDLEISATIENIGDRADTQLVTIDAGELGSEVEEIDLDTGESTTVTLSFATNEDQAGEYSIVVNTDDDEHEEVVTVDERQPLPALFDLDIAGQGVEASVLEGTDEDLTVDVENVGTAAESFDLTLEINDATVSTETTGSIDPDERETVTFESPFADLDQGDYDVTVTVNDDSLTGSLRVEAATESFFAVSDLDAEPAPVTQGEDLTISATIENTGGVADTQDVTMEFGESAVTMTESLALDAGVSDDVSFTFDTDELPEVTLDYENFEYSVSTANDTATDSTTVASTPEETFQVGAVDAPSTVDAGQQFTVSATITNTGDAEGTQTIELQVGGFRDSTERLTLGEGQSQSVSFTTAINDPGTATVSVVTDQDSGSTTVNVEETEANFDVAIESTNAPIQAGETLTVTAGITNTGDGSGDQSITLDAGALGSTSTQVSLAPGESTSEQLSVTTNTGDAGDHTVTVSSADDSDSTSVTVEAGDPHFEVAIQSTNDPIEAGDQLTVDVAIDNTGDGSGTQTISLDAEALGSASVSVTLDAGESTTEQLSVGTGTDDDGTYTVTVSSEDDSDSTSVSVEEPPEPNFQVDFSDHNAPITEGDDFVMFGVEVTNTGDASDTQTVTLEIPGVGQHSEQVTLDPGESVSFTQWRISTSDGDAGDHQATLSSDDDSVSVPVTISES